MDDVVYLSELMNLDDLCCMVKDGYIDVRVHPDDASLKIMSYSRSAQFDGKWNSVTTQARGLIIRSSVNDFSDAVVVERPWRKFFTLTQLSSDANGRRAWSLGDEEDGYGDNSNSIDSVDFEAPVEVTDKIDGSMGILYCAPNGDVAFATKGSFSSLQAIAYTDFLRNNKNYHDAATLLREIHPDKTFIFELIGLDNQIVIAYDTTDVILLGAVGRKTGIYYSPNDFVDVWSKDKGLSVTDTFQAKNLQDALALPEREGKEGVVVRFVSDIPENQFQLKIKYKDYLVLHRLVTSVSRTSVFNLLMNSDVKMSDLLNVGHSGTSRSIKSVSQSLSFLETHGTALRRQVEDKNFGMLDDILVPYTKKIVDAYDYVKNIPDEDLVGDDREVMRRMAEVIKKEKDAFVRSQKFSFLQVRMQNKDVDSINTERILRSIFRV